MRLQQAGRIIRQRRIVEIHPVVPQRIRRRCTARKAQVVFAGNIGQVDVLHPEFLPGERACKSRPDGIAHLPSEAGHFDRNLFVSLDQMLGQGTGHLEVSDGIVCQTDRQGGQRFLRNLRPGQVRPVGHHDEIIQFVGQVKVEAALGGCITVHERARPAEHIKDAFSHPAFFRRLTVGRFRGQGATRQGQRHVARLEFFGTNGTGLPVAAQGCDKECTGHK